MSWHQRAAQNLAAGFLAGVRGWRRPVASGLLTVLFATVTPHGLTTFGWVLFSTVLYIVVGLVIAEARRQTALSVIRAALAIRRGPPGPAGPPGPMGPAS